MENPKQLDDKGRCCGKKPRVYKRWPYKGRFCFRCCRSYDLEGNDQIENWAWHKLPDGQFERKDLAGDIKKIQGGI